MSVNFDLSEFKKAFEAAVGEQRSTRGEVSFEFDGKQIPVQGQTKLSDAVLEYLDSISSKDAFTGPEKFQELRPGALIDYLQDNKAPVEFMARAVRAAKLLQQAMRNDRHLNDVWQPASADLHMIEIDILASTWIKGQQLRQLWTDDQERRFQNEQRRNSLGLGDMTGFDIPNYNS